MTSLGWFTVDDTLPDDNQYVLGYADEWGLFLGWRDGDYWKHGPDGSDGQYISLVTHWQPVQEPS